MSIVSREEALFGDLPVFVSQEDVWEEEKDLMQDSPMLVCPLCNKEISGSNQSSQDAVRLAVIHQCSTSCILSQTAVGTIRRELLLPLIISLIRSRPLARVINFVI